MERSNNIYICILSWPCPLIVIDVPQRPFLVLWAPLGFLYECLVPSEPQWIPRKTKRKRGESSYENTFLYSNYSSSWYVKYILVVLSNSKLTFCISCKIQKKVYIDYHGNRFWWRKKEKRCGGTNPNTTRKFSRRSKRNVRKPVVFSGFGL